ncbi:uncharacterized protein LOC120278432 isoform X2 [Dioscorea cayenensis subsp. rotundata]|uniref:Uncharacterized protein LOC120278432 isoform X2 n=1 Tax=Dioscorea cayennensis subsp. rotundata TaxID=55577 RepID=A0AB40CM96_DIOCR|nr:uncharacterized protein LOC120278432 isoform X2 [Dioscorea cayenensis subsp. rotundata]
MGDNWAVRTDGDEPPSYSPNSEYFAIKMHYTIGDVCKMDGHRLAGYIDYCCADKISKLELISMSKELNLEVEGCSFWWLDLTGGNTGLTEIKNDQDVLAIALGVGYSRVVNVYVKVSKRDEDANLEGTSLGKESKGQEEDEESELHYLEYSFHSGEEEQAVEERMAISEIPPLKEIRGEGSVDEDVIQSDCASSEEFQSCSSTDEEELDPLRPRYTEFNEELDMKDPHFKIGMKFRSFKQFKEAVKNYGIKNKCVMNFKPNNKKRCKAFCKRGCPFYLWASPMVNDKNTVQIKSGVLKHECMRDHNIRHVSAEWIAKNYLDQFRADPSWKIAGIIQAVRTNQDANISRLKAWRAKRIAASHILHTTQDKNCWSKSDQAPIIPLEPANKNRGRKPLLRRKEADEENTGFIKGKVSRRGIIITCSICGAQGHNKRYHGQQGKNQKRKTGQAAGRSSGAAMANEDDSNDQDPMDTIDPQVQHNHFAQTMKKMNS